MAAARTRVGPAAAALTKFEKDFEKSFGEGSLISADKKPFNLVSTGSLDFDQKLGGGIVVGRLHQWWGPGGTFKTTMAMILAANFQKAYPDRMVGWIDMERTFNDFWAEEHGLDLDRRRFRRTKPETAEDVADMAKKMVRTGFFSIIIIDSVGGMIGKTEMEKDADEAAVATVARVVTRMVKQQAVFCDDTGTTMLIINQPRANISGGPKAGNTKGGGNALSHVTTSEGRFRQTAQPPYSIGSGDAAAEVGYQIAVQITRNKIAPKGRTAVFDFFTEETDKFGPVGLDRATEAFTMGTRLGIIEKVGNGNYWQLEGLVKTNGEKQTVTALREHPNLIEKIRAQVLALSAHEVAEALAPVTEEEIDEPGAEGTIDAEFSTGRASRTDMDLDPDALARARTPEKVAAS